MPQAWYTSGTFRLTYCVVLWFTWREILWVRYDRMRLIRKVQTFRVHSVHLDLCNFYVLLLFVDWCWNGTWTCDRVLSNSCRISPLRWQGMMQLSLSWGKQKFQALFVSSHFSTCFMHVLVLHRNAMATIWARNNGEKKWKCVISDSYNFTKANGRN